MMTNTGKTKAEIILELVLSINRGDSAGIERRVHWAVQQYNDLVARGIIKEVEHYDEQKLTTEEDVSKLFRPPVGPF